MGDKCARCGGTLHWYNEKQENPDGEGQICEECLKQDRAIIKEEKEAGKGYFASVDIISNLDAFSELKLKYILIGEFSTQGRYFSLIKAINLLAERGWRCLNITHGIDIKPMSSIFQSMYALMEKVE